MSDSPRHTVRGFFVSAVKLYHSTGQTVPVGVKVYQHPASLRKQGSRLPRQDAQTCAIRKA